MQRRRGAGQRRGERGITFVTILLLAALGGAAWWLVTYGPVIWESHEVKVLARQAANIAYGELDDAKIRAFLVDKTRAMSEYEYEEMGERKKGWRIDLREEDILIERNKVPAWIKIDLTYTRTWVPAWGGGERQKVFHHHVEQDLTPVKW